MGVAFALRAHSASALGESGSMLLLGFFRSESILVHSRGKSKVFEVYMASSTIV